LTSGINGGGPPPKKFAISREKEFIFNEVRDSSMFNELRNGSSRVFNSGTKKLSIS
jgi:hypothetical protein